MTRSRFHPGRDVEGRQGDKCRGALILLREDMGRGAGLKEIEGRISHQASTERRLKPLF